MMDVVQGFLGWLFETVSGIFGGLVDFLTFNPLRGLGSPITSALMAGVRFVDRFVSVRQLFAAVGSAALWFVLLVVAGIIWRWIRGL